VKKKAALTLLRLYRKHPEVIPAAEWALRIVSIMDDQDLVIGLPISADELRSGWVNIIGRSNLRNEPGHGSSTRPLGRFCGVLHQSCRSVASGISNVCTHYFFHKPDDTLQLVIGHEYSATYAYYKVPSPWLQVKLLRLLQYYPPTGRCC
jgi:AP-2 complex subunit alpha